MSKSQRFVARSARRRTLAVAETVGGFVLAGAAASQAKDGHAAHLAHELAIGHYLAMRLAAEASSFISRLDAAAPDEHDRLPLEALRLVGGTARLMDRFRRGLLALPFARGPGPDPLPRPAIAFRPQSNPPERESTPPDTPPPNNRGWLRHGNRPGDYLAAPRCGACTRAGTPCRQPAMKNGRCRFHGGKSTGPRTAAGLERSRTARLIHGGDSESLRALRSAAAASARTLARLTPARRGVLAGHGLHPTNRPWRPRAAGRRPPHGPATPSTN